MNTSINEALSRTILTGGATLIPLICLFLVGGSVLRDFALAILIGLLVGTYSSIFIASPVVLWWNKARGGSTHTLRREVTEAVTRRQANCRSPRSLSDFGILGRKSLVFRPF